MTFLIHLTILKHDRNRAKSSIRNRIYRFNFGAGATAFYSSGLKRKKGAMKKIAQAFANINYCQKCGRTDLPLQLDHIKLRSRGGKDEVENIQKLCIKCHLGIKHGWNIKSFLGKKI